MGRLTPDIPHHRYRKGRLVLDGMTIAYLPENIAEAILEKARAYKDAPQQLIGSGLTINNTVTDEVDGIQVAKFSNMQLTLEPGVLPEEIKYDG